jgi:bifunctional non-homologous end joining protein LigD
MGFAVSLQEYQAKRRFEESPEPRGGETPSSGPLRFVVQKHRATRLHYDFRLELGGTLKSWALPKGPSLNPEDKRLAVMVEDHPLEYASFEGVIPAGNYGAGTVMIWDEGTYEAPGASDRRQSEALLEAGLRKGHLSFALFGKKLMGRFALLKTRGQGEKGWLLVKKQDEFASSEDVRARDRSAVSRRGMEGIAEQSRKTGSFWLSSSERGRLDFADAPRAPMPRKIKPMLATPVDESFDRAGWFFEIKWDGYRAIAEVEGQKVSLYSRKHLSFERMYAPIVESLTKLGHDAVLDGEIVVLDAAGKSQFQLLQNYQQTKKGPLVYFVFDLLYLDGHDVRGLPLRRRKELLTQILPQLSNIKISEHIETNGVAFFAAVAEQGLEGIMAKDGASRYADGKRGKSWLKIKTHHRQEAIICGYTAPRNTRQHFGALILGVRNGDELVHIGQSGSGFTDRSLTDVYARLKPLVQSKSPFKKAPKTETKAHWVKPELVCEISFAGWTEDGHARFPIFQGLREDKQASEVRREQPVPAETIAAKPTPQPSLGTLRHKKVQVQIGEHPVQLTNLSKVYWPDEGFTKGDLIDYYRQVADFILPYLKDRPQSMHRHPNGILAKSFFQKDVSRQPPPDWVQTIDIQSEHEPKSNRYLLCQDEATLLYLANLGCIEINPWNSRLGSLEKPDYLLIDLDPEDISFERVVEVARTVHETLDEIGATSVCKTSGKRGLHVYVPLGARYGHEHAKQFAELLVSLVHRRVPLITSLARMPKQRQQRVYLDWLQNGRGKTLAAPYCVRPYKGATVSAPLQWKEVRAGLDPAKFTMKTMPERLARVGDLWGPILSAGIDLNACLENMASVLQKRL